MIDDLVYTVVWRLNHPHPYLASSFPSSTGSRRHEFAFSSCAADLQAWSSDAPGQTPWNSSLQSMFVKTALLMIDFGAFSHFLCCSLPSVFPKLNVGQKENICCQALREMSIPFPLLLARHSTRWCHGNIGNTVRSTKILSDDVDPSGPIGCLWMSWDLGELMTCGASKLVRRLEVPQRHRREVQDFLWGCMPSKIFTIQFQEHSKALLMMFLFLICFPSLWICYISIHIRIDFDCCYYFFLVFSVRFLSFRTFCVTTLPTQFVTLAGQRWKMPSYKCLTHPEERIISQEKWSVAHTITIAVVGPLEETMGPILKEVESAILKAWSNKDAENILSSANLRASHWWHLRLCPCRKKTLLRPE